MKIYCPRCEWAPGPHDRWSCAPGCHTMWNTFDTGGTCPGCGKKWRFTQCLACHAMSLHEDWYHDDEDDSADEEAWEREHERERVYVGAEVRSAPSSARV